MKFAHISDLHLGKKLNHFSLLEDQKYILEQILDIVDDTEADALLIAGDVYDKPVPAAEAVTLFDDFLAALAGRKLPVFVISGNHDSPERIAFASRLIAASGVYLSPLYRGEIRPVMLEDEYGPLYVYMLPFIKPVHVRRYFPEEEIRSYTDALRCVIGRLDLDRSQRNILVAHQFVTGALCCESEELSVGGLDNVDAEVFSDFDYVALGHIHSPQSIGSEAVRYSGTPLKYSFSEVRQKKSVTVAELREKGDLSVEKYPLAPLRELTELRGTFEEIMDAGSRKEADTDAYVRITLSDERDVPNAFHKLCTVYPNLMYMDYERRGQREEREERITAVEGKVDPGKLFSEFYEKMNHQPLSGEQEDYLAEKIEKIWSHAE